MNKLLVFTAAYIINNKAHNCSTAFYNLQSCDNSEVQNCARFDIFNLICQNAAYGLIDWTSQEINGKLLDG